MFEKLAKSNFRVGFFGGCSKASFEGKDRDDPNKTVLIQGFKLSYCEIINPQNGIGFKSGGEYFLTVQKFKEIFGDVTCSDVCFRDCVVSVAYNASTGKKSLKAVAFI